MRSCGRGVMNFHNHQPSDRKCLSIYVRFIAPLSSPPPRSMIYGGGVFSGARE